MCFCKTTGLFVSAAAILLAAGCDLLQDQEDFTEEYFVYSQLTALEPLPKLELTVTVPFDTDYSRSEHSVEGARVRVYLLNTAGGRETTYIYNETGRGTYQPADDSVTIRPLRTYELEIDVPSGSRITSVTTVPDTLRITHALRDSVVYLGSEQLEYYITKSRKVLNRQHKYVLATRFSDPDRFGLTPYYESGTLNRDGLKHTRSEIFNEASFKDLGDLLAVPVPWENISYYGPLELLIHVIDDNMIDFYRTLDDQTGNDRLAPGEMRNITYNIEGGIGLFGSKSTATARGFVAPED